MTKLKKNSRRGSRGIYYNKIKYLYKKYNRRKRAVFIFYLYYYSIYFSITAGLLHREVHIGIITVNADVATAIEAAAPEESEEESGPVRVRTFADVKNAAARAIRYITSSSSCPKTIYYVLILLSYY